MASISILEKDLTTANSSSTTANVVYVPGYAIMGPVNEPTLCSNLNEFEQIFGPTPYKFKQAQIIEDEPSLNDYIQANGYEKSYIYAAELLKAGLPILFERVSTVQTYATSALNLIEQCYHAAVYQSDIQFILQDQVGTLDGETYEYTYTFNQQYAPKITGNEITDLTIQCYSNDTRIDCTISEIQSETEDDKTTTTVTFTTTEESLNRVIIRYALNEKINWNIFGIYDPVKNRKDLSWLVYQNETQIQDAQVQFIKETNNRVFISYNSDLININNEEAILKDKTTKVLNINTGNQLNITLPSANNGQITVSAKYPGVYGEQISYNVESEYKSTPNEFYYNFYVTLKTDLDEVKEPITVCLNATDKKYIKNVNSNIIKFNVDKLDQMIYSLGLYKLEDKQNVQLVYNGDIDKDEFEVQAFYNKLKGSDTEDSIFVKLEDKDEYDVKFITSGSYPIIGLSTNSIMNTMLVTAANRGDTVALLDHIDKDQTIYDTINTILDPKIVSGVTGEDAKKYGAMFTPWGKYQLQTIDEVTSFPGSFGYLKCLGASSKTNPNWYAVSGVIRGQVPNLLELNQKVTGALANKLQARKGISINPITNIKPYGYCIWGNRTLLDNIDDLTASSFLNIRMISNDVKKVVYKAAKKLTFELNSDVLWLNFKASIEPTLEQMKSGNGLSDYKIIKVPTSKKATISCIIRLYAIEAVEDWDITVELADSYTTIE